MTWNSLTRRLEAQAIYDFIGEKNDKSSEFIAKTFPMHACFNVIIATSHDLPQNLNDFELFKIISCTR